MSNEAEFQLKQQKKNIAQPKDGRKAQEYYKDQLLFLKMKEIKIEDRKKRLDEIEKKTYTFKPTLSKYAAEKKEKELKEQKDNSLDVTNRLYSNTQNNIKGKKGKATNSKEANSKETASGTNKVI